VREAKLAQDGDTREIIPAGPVDGWSGKPGFMLPVVDFLIERGHLPLAEDGESDRGPGNDRNLTRIINPSDWAAINKRFAMPDNITYLDGLIRDNANRCDVNGYDELTGLNGEITFIEIWEDEQVERRRRSAP
jgi:hypothetical protein